MKGRINFIPVKRNSCFLLFIKIYYYTYVLITRRVNMYNPLIYVPIDIVLTVTSAPLLETSVVNETLWKIKVDTKDVNENSER